MNTSSVAARPGPALPIPVPEVMTSGRPDPASAAPSASMARLSLSQFAANREKSWSKAVWITPSDTAAPLRRLSGSSRSPRCASAPAAASSRAPASERVSPSTWWPAPMSSATTAVPMKPVAPVTNTRMEGLRMLFRTQGSAGAASR